MSGISQTKAGPTISHGRGKEYLSYGKVLGFPVYALTLVCIFSLALGIRIWFNFFAPHMNAYGACDASEYLRNTKALLSLTKLPASFWTDSFLCLTGNASPEIAQSVKTCLSGLSELKISGPVFPAFLASGFLLAGIPFDSDNWTIMLIAQSIVSALTCALIAHTAKMAWDSKSGVVAGMAAAFYPGFIINSGRLYSETFAAFLLTLALCLTVHDLVTSKESTKDARRNWLWQLFKGLVLASLQLTRSIMVVLTVALIPLTFFANRKRHPFRSVGFMVLGFALIAAPWLALQNLAFGKASLVVDRVGHYNLFIGNNIDTQGWLSVPYPDGRGIEEKTFPTLLTEAIKKSPSAWIKLMADKPLRLFQFPWNDFRAPIGDFSVANQVAYHQLVLLLCALGIALALFSKTNKSILTARIFLLSILAFHLVYCLFITVPRYNLTSIPIVSMFAGAGLVALVQLLLNKQTRTTAYFVIAASLVFVASMQLGWTADSLILNTAIKTASVLLLATAAWLAGNKIEGNNVFSKILIVALSILSLPACLPARAHGRFLEWQLLLNKTEAAKTFSLTELSALQKQNCYLLIDSQGLMPLVQNATITVNGQTLNGPFIPGLSLVNDLDRPLPIGKGKVGLEQEYIFDCLTTEAGCSNSDLRQWFLLPIPPELLAEKLEVRISNKGSQPLTLFGSSAKAGSAIIPHLKSYSWEKAFYGVEDNNGLTDTHYDEKVRVNTQGHSGKYLNVFLLANTPANASGGRILAATASDNKDLTLALPQYKKDDLWLVRLSGQMEGTQESEAGINLELKGQSNSGQISYKSPWMSKRLPIRDSSDHYFDFAFIVKPSAIPGELKQLQAKFAPVGELYTHRNYHQDVIPEVKLNQMQATITSIGSMPLEGNYKLYLGDEEPQ